MLTFAVAVFFLLITPGPGVLTTAGVGSAYGWNQGLKFLAGLCVGTNLVALAVVSGLWAIVASIEWLRPILVWASVAFFVYLASKIALAGAQIKFMETAKPGFMNGLLLQFINPKAYAVNNLMFSGYAFMADNLAAEVIVKFIIINAVWIPVHLIWLWAGVSLKRMNLAPGIQRAINIAMAASLLIVVGLAAWSQL